ncbi:hypothetical protein LCGC14_2886400 [marine sediment metagenome]|uniref:Uncharacterized protein n=1 Tax=marine sediment metagenome TaxID=412755 RepID=A0A0F9APN5_9ZZZZ
MKPKYKIVEVPDWSPNELNYILEVRTFINSVQSEIIQQPPRCFGKNRVKRIDLHWNKLFNKFIFRTYWRTPRRNQSGIVTSYYPSNTIKEDPLECLKMIMEQYPKLNWNKFISTIEEKIEPKIIPHNIDNIYFDVKYLKVREQIISYIEQKISKRCKGLKELKKLFVYKNTMTFGDFLDKKSKLLSELNLKDYVTELNKQTERKRVSGNILDTRL